VLREFNLSSRDVQNAANTSSSCRVSLAANALQAYPGTSIKHASTDFSSPLIDIAIVHCKLEETTIVVFSSVEDGINDVCEVQWQI